jgi:hypothetical protein
MGQLGGLEYYVHKTVMATAYKLVLRGQHDVFLFRCQTLGNATAVAIVQFSMDDVKRYPVMVQVRALVREA